MTGPRFVFFVLRPRPPSSWLGSSSPEAASADGRGASASTAPFEIAVATVTVDCVEPEKVARFWSELLGYVVVPNFTDSIEIGDPRGSGPHLLFTGAGGPKNGKNRVHLDLRPEDQDEAVRRAEALGARRVELGQGESSSVVLQDPEGNELCILQSRAAYERFRASRER